MISKSLKLERARLEIKNLNEMFHSEKLLGVGFYIYLKKKNFKIQNSVLIKIIPEGRNTCSGEIIRQDSRVFEFDIDIDEIEYSDMKDITVDFFKELKFETIHNPSNVRVCSYELFKEINNS